MAKPIGINTANTNTTFKSIEYILITLENKKL